MIDDDRDQRPSPAAANNNALDLGAALAVQKRALEMTALGEPIREILKRLAKAVEDAAQGDAVVGILSLDASGRLHTLSAPSLPEDYSRAIDGLQAAAHVGTCSAAAATRSVVVTPDIAADPKWHGLAELPLALGLVAAWSQPIIDREGAVLGTFGTYFRTRRAPSEAERASVEVLSEAAAVAIARWLKDEEAERRQRLLQRAMDAAEMGAWELSVADRVCRCDERACRLYGLDGSSFEYTPAGLSAFVHPDDRPRVLKALDDAIQPGGAGRYQANYRVRDGDSWRWLSAIGEVEFTGLGSSREPATIYGATRDISEQTKQDEQRLLMVNELNHRVKNTLATVQSVVAQTLRSNDPPKAMREALTARLIALSHAHDVLTDQQWSGANLRDIVTGVLKPYMGEGSERISFHGPSVRLSPRSAVDFALVVHELSTNAAKYGALSNDSGRVAIDWALAPKGDRTGLIFVWKEDGGPPVSPPTRKGFGSRLIDRGLPDEFGSVVRTDYPATGFTYALHADLAQEALPPGAVRLVVAEAGEGWTVRTASGVQLFATQKDAISSVVRQLEELRVNGRGGLVVFESAAAPGRRRTLRSERG